MATALRLAEATDAEAIARMLEALARHLGEGERHLSDAATVRRHGFGPKPQFEVILAEEGREPRGLSLFFPLYSTTRAAPGVYVQDLWVEDAARGSGLGRRLLVATLRHARAGWGASFLKLTVHHDNAGADAFYRRLGFVYDPRERPAFLEGAAFQLLSEDP